MMKIKRIAGGSDHARHRAATGHPRPVRERSWPPAAIVAMAFAALTVLGACAIAFVEGTRLHATLRGAMAEEEADESRLVCARLGHPAGTPGYPGCGVELTALRLARDERVRRHTLDLP